VVTRPKVYVPASSLEEAFHQIDLWMQSPGLQLIGETMDHAEKLKELALRGQSFGARIHDARIAAICLQHGVAELWTADRDFQHFPALKTHNPLVS
jgi:uncharacterized protein